MVPEIRAGASSGEQFGSCRQRGGVNQPVNSQNYPAQRQIQNVENAIPEEESAQLTSTHHGALSYIAHQRHTFLLGNRGSLQLPRFLLYGRNCIYHPVYILPRDDACSGLFGHEVSWASTQGTSGIYFWLNWFHTSLIMGAY